ncbi:MAG: S8 family serine peptidase [Flavobacterium sp.]|nr:S8 family serine peptidase [Flavobacterium sp.]
MSKTTCALLLTLLFTTAYAQTAKEVLDITKDYDLKEIKTLEKYYTQRAQIERHKAEIAAKANNWPIYKTNADGSVDELMKLTRDGFPLYYSVSNVNAAVSTRANILQNVYGLLGENMVARVWDGGKVRASHDEFLFNRVTVVDDTAGPSGNNFHSTHVTGTVIAGGVDPAAMGMAPMGSARTFNWTNDVGEALSEVQGGMLLSNHSYGVPSANAPDWYIGSYTDESRDWDVVAYASPYYLQVVSAGNNGFDANPNPSITGFDKLTGNKVSKNNLVVANAQDANISSTGNLISVAINGSSSQGPSDDYRIKPDITGNGTNLYSCLESSDNAYGVLSGTSMASPNVMGTLLLLQQYYNNTNQHFMKAATLKALACHTADDAGTVGPDVIFGWGLLNGKKAAETITQNGLSSLINEETLQDGQTYTMTVHSSGLEPLQATIAWTDVPGELSSGFANDMTPVLVNDLDIRIKKNIATFYPWRLNIDGGAVAINDGDNNVDNVEKVVVNNPVGNYTITVTHKGTLVNGAQNFSLVVTGAQSNFSITPLSPDKTVCSNETASYTFNYTSTTSDTANFSAIGLPAGAIASFNATSASSSGVITMTISNLQNVTPGAYSIGFKGTNSTESETDNVGLRVFNNTFSNLILTSPSNNQEGLSTAIPLVWQQNVNAQQYRIQVATDNAFTNLIVNQLTDTNNYTVTDLLQATRYYWRVLPKNLCGEATSNTIYRFDTGSQSCGNVFSATDFSNAFIDNVENSEASVPITVTGNVTVGSMTVDLNITHTYIQDFTVYLEGPEAIGSPQIVLFQEPCGDNDNMNCTVSDNGVPFTCAPDPGISGVVLPLEPLSSFNNLPAAGVWTLRVFDSYNGDGGTINSVNLNFCNVTNANLGVEDALIAKVTVYPNPTKGIVNVSLPQNTTNTILQLFDIQGRKILSKTTNNSEEVINIENLQEGVYLLTVENEQYKTTKKIVLNK